MIMGIWEAMNSTAEEVKRRLPDPAHLKNVCSSSAHLKNVCSSAHLKNVCSSAHLKNVCTSAHLKNVCSSAHCLGTSAFNRARAVSPDFSTASRFFSQSYDGGSNAAAWLFRTVRVDAPHRIRAIVSEPDAQVRIGRTAWNLIDYTLEHSTRAYTGGIPVYKILKEGLSDERRANEGNGLGEMRRRLESLEALVAARGAEGALGEGIKGSGASRYDCRMPGVSQPTDVIDSFIAGGFNGGDFISEQVIPVIAESQKKARRDFLLCKLN